MTGKTSPSTNAQYTSKAESLTNEFNSQEAGQAMELEKWIRYRVRNVTARTWTLYRSALLWALKSNIVSFNKYSNKESIKILSTIQNLKTAEKKKSKNTSRQKQKHIPEDKFLILQARLENSKSEYDKYILHWLKATISVGLRMTEWTTSKLKKGKNNTYLLIVENAKYSQKRSFGKYREIIIQASNKDIESIIKIRRKLVSKFEENGISGYEKFYRSCRDRLLWINKSISHKRSDKNITLYSARHQFKANMQSEGKDCYELAALMGHRSILSASENYGKKQFGKPTTMKIKAMPKYVELVKSLNVGKESKLSYRPGQKVGAPEFSNE